MKLIVLVWSGSVVVTVVLGSWNAWWYVAAAGLFVVGGLGMSIMATIDSYKDRKCRMEKNFERYSAREKANAEFYMNVDGD